MHDDACHVGCSTKSLNRATRAVVDLAARQVIVDRVVVEANRALAHSGLTVASVGARLGFDEPINFVKFFRRTTGVTPGDFAPATATPGDDARGGTMLFD